MTSVLGIGVATLDIINTVDAYPEEDTKVRALRQRICRGGNAANTLVILSQLGHGCAWAGTLADDGDCGPILKDLQTHAIDTSAMRLIAGGRTPVSYIVHSASRGTRTVVHYRALPEYDFASFRGIRLDEYDWLHFEGRNIAETREMLAYARAALPHVMRSVEIEEARPDIETLFGLADVLLFARRYAKARGSAAPEEFLRGVRRGGTRAKLVCAWGEEGAYGLDETDRLVASSAFPPEALVDTVGAGDTFNAGIIDALAQRLPLAEALRSACRLAGEKCGHEGLDFIARRANAVARRD